MQRGTGAVSRYSLCYLELQLGCDYTERGSLGGTSLSIQGQTAADCQSVCGSYSESANTFAPVGCMPLVSLAACLLGGKNSLADTL